MVEKSFILSDTEHICIGCLPLIYFSEDHDILLFGASF